VSNVTTLTHKRTGAIRVEAPSERQTRVYLMGAMRAVGPGGEDVLPRAKKAQAVLAYLCLAQGERVPRSRLAGVIWDRSGEAQARESLRHALRELDRTGTWPLETDHETVRLDIARCWVDAFETPDRPDLLLDSLYGISPTFDQWLIGERMRFETRWQTTLENDLGDLVAKNVAPALRAAAARKLLNFLPTHEPAVRSLMTAFVEMDDRAQAVREYERFRSVITSSLGMPPSEKTVALREAIRLESRARAARAPTSNGTLPLTGSIGGPMPAQADSLPVAPTGAAPACDLQPSIAVLPFRNLSAAPGHGLVAEGLVDDLVEAVSRVPSLFVISRLSAAAFRNQDRPPLEIGEALGVRYILSGSVRVSGNRLRLFVELIETDSGRALSISRFDTRFSDLLDLQNDLADTVASSIAPHLRAAELKRVRIKRPEDYNAYDLFLRAQESMHSPSRATFESSQRLFELAIAREPQYGAALAWLAYWHVMRVGQGWSPDPAFDTTQAEHFAQRAIECDDLEAMGFAVRGHVAAYLRRDFDLGISSFEKALQINPNSARAWLWNATAHGWIGEGARAVEKITRAMALSPYDPLVCAYSGGASMAYLADGQYDRAIEFALRCIRENRGYTSAYKLLISALVLAGRAKEARAPVHQLLLLEPGFTVQEFRRRFPGAGRPLFEGYCDAFASAGVPLSD
jgi:TolB-like protein/DNA-binding SARP family transcriptional activator